MAGEIVRTTQESEGHFELEVNRILKARDEITAAQRRREPERVVAAERELLRAARAANDLGMSWTAIGDLFGIRRGAAYQRYRRRPGELRPDDKELHGACPPACT